MTTASQPEMFRLIREIKPQFVIGENVQGIINIQNGMVLRQVQDDLESEGFEVNVSLFQASGIGAWHQRKRVWILQYPTPMNIKHGSARLNEGTDMRSDKQVLQGPNDRQHEKRGLNNEASAMVGKDVFKMAK